MMLRISMLFMLVLLAGCSGKKTTHQKELDASHASIIYREQEEERKRIENAGTTLGHQKEIDVDGIDFDRINFDYVWTVDIPIPLDAVEKRDYCQATPEIYIAGYTTQEGPSELVDFYKQQMISLGWDHQWETQGLETLLIFEKPHKHCAVSIRPGSSRKKTDIVFMQKIV